MKNLAIIDLGSNSARLSIQEISDAGQSREVKRLKIQSRLAEGMGQDAGPKKLQPAAIKRTLAAIDKFKHIYEQYPHLKMTGIATAAVRAAENRDDFLAQVKELTGVDVNVLSGEKEAYYDYLGVVSTLDIQDCLICDMGGGSFELALVREKKAENLISIPYGAVSLSEKFHAADQISGADLFAFLRFIQDKFNQLPWLEKGRKLPLVLLGGANRTVGRRKLAAAGKKDLDTMHGLKLSAAEFIDRYQSWLEMGLDQRRKALGDEAERADIIIGGLTPVVQLLGTLDIPQVIFSDSGVREGIIYELLHE